MQPPKQILLIVVFAQFCCTSLWFAGNGVLPQLSETFQLPSEALGFITSAVQFGFIFGTLLFALLTIADRFSPSKVFFGCAVLGAITNIAILNQGNTLVTLVLIRFLTGFFLAGIYPVGMKIAADYFDKDLGKSLGYLVGALVLGTAFPHLINTFTVAISWHWVIVATSALAILGGSILVLFVSDGPYRKAASRFNVGAIKQVFKNKNFRSAAFGYFGHMWELYAFWAFVPMFIAGYSQLHRFDSLNISLWSFLIIGIGSIGCSIAGKFSQYFGSKKVGAIALMVSGVCCILSPLFFYANSFLFIVFMLVWGTAVIADSPMFSSLIAKNTVPNLKGTALTIVNCIGFSITIISIQVVSIISTLSATKYVFLVLAIGPLFGLLALRKRKL